MKQRIVVTNLRIPESQWEQVKIASSMIGVSTNEYVKHALDTSITRDIVGTPQKIRIKRKRRTIWDLVKLAKIKDVPMGASEEDKIIYGIK